MELRVSLQPVECVMLHVSAGMTPASSLNYTRSDFNLSFSQYNNICYIQLRTSMFVHVLRKSWKFIPLEKSWGFYQISGIIMIF